MSVTYTIAKRTYDFLLASVGLLLLMPVFAAIALCIKLFDRGPVFYRQTRVGLKGRPFAIVKFRTMMVDADKQGPSITRDGDARITFVGRVLRKTKLDELPQLINVVRGEMSLVGPRPEVPKYVATYTEDQKRVLTLKPGITDLATLAFRNEEELLHSVADFERYYVSNCVPEKIRLNLQYAQRASIWEDTKLIVKTLASCSMAPRLK